MTTIETVADDELFAEFARHQKLHRMAAGTIKSRENTIRRILGDNGLTLQTLTEEALEDFFVANYERFAPKTVHVHLSACKAFYTVSAEISKAMLPRGRITVRESLADVRGELITQPPKSASRES